MSKIIKMTAETINAICEDFRSAIEKMKLSDGKVTFTKTIGSVDRKATLYFTEMAYLKMVTLVREFDKEVAWHGVAFRGDDPEKDEYIIKDILVYPQEVTGATVNTDQEGYQTWLMSHEDEVFNNIRMQGHSHVNMGVSPSTVDTSLYERILDQLDDTMFYIFLIWNKRGEKTIKIYDLAKNILFETGDVEVKTTDEGMGLEEFLANAKEMVKTKPTTSYSPTNKWNGYAGYPGYSGYTGQQKKTETQVASISKEKEEAKKEFDTTTKRTSIKEKSGGSKGNHWYDDEDTFDSYYGRGGYYY